MTGDWRKMYNEELHDLYYSLNIFRVMQPRRMRWARHVALCDNRCVQDFGGETRMKKTTWKTLA